MYYAVILLYVLGAYGIMLTASNGRNGGLPVWDEPIDSLSATMFIVWPITVVLILCLATYDTLTSNHWKL